MTKKSVAEHLPEKAPKRTGRAGIKPLDPVEDFESPTRVPPEPEPPTSEEVKEFLDGAAATREKRAAKKKPVEITVQTDQRLPGMEDAAIEELEDAAKRYAVVRDKRMALTDQEVDMKELLLTLMTRHGKKEYRHHGIEIKVVPEGAKVKVRIEED
jgi:hypothetical protein